MRDFFKSQELYIFNTTTLAYEQVKKRKNFLFLSTLVVLLVFFVLNNSIVRIKQVVEKIPVIIEQKEERCTPENIKAYLEIINVRYPDIVYKQVMLESNNLKSPLVKSHNNIICMQNSKIRPTVGIDIGTRWAKYNNWKECLIDYALWQTYMAKDIKNEEEYYALLDKVYCPSDLLENQGELYSNKLKKINNK